GICSYPAAISAGSSSSIPSGLFSCLSRSTELRLRTSSHVAVAIGARDSTRGGSKSKVTFANEADELDSDSELAEKRVRVRLDLDRPAKRARPHRRDLPVRRECRRDRRAALRLPAVEPRLAAVDEADPRELREALADLREQRARGDRARHGVRQLPAELLGDL